MESMHVLHCEQYEELLNHNSELIENQNIEIMKILLAKSKL